MRGSLIARDSGIPKKTIGKIIKRCLDVSSLNVNMIYIRAL